MYCVASSWEGVCVWLYLLSVCDLFLPRVAVPGEDARHDCCMSGSLKPGQISRKNKKYVPDLWKLDH